MHGGDDRLTAKELAERLNGRREGNYYKAHCPAHDDKEASLAISEREGKVLFRCHAGCTQDAVLEQLRDRDLWPKAKLNGHANGAHAPKPRIVATYDYVDATGQLVSQVVRYEPKTFKQRHRDELGDWEWSLKGVRVVPYRLPDLLEAIGNGQTVFVVEGEKDADNIAKIGIAATCNAGGAGKWRAEHAAYLKGANVIIIPDNDEPGRKHTKEVAALLVGIAKSLRIVELPGLTAKGADVSDWLANGGTAERLWAIVENTAKPPLTEPTPKPTSDEDPPHWNVEPWPEPISGAELLDEICGILRRYMVLPKYAAEAIALWALHAWTIGAWEISPLLIVVSPTKQCGKSTLLAILFWILPRSELFANATASPIFRLIEDAKPATPTFLFDEGDSYFKPDKEDLRGIINSGWMKVTARVIRTEGDGNKRRARRFSTWAAKVIATIKAVADTLMDRGIIIKMRRATKAEKKTVQRFLMRDIAEFAELRRKSLRWANDETACLADADPRLPEALANRPADNWRPLLAIADAARGDWPKRALDAALGLSGLAGKEDRSIDLLADVRRVFDEGGEDWLGAEALVERLVALPETPWAEWRPGDRPITSRGVARMLSEFEIESDDKHRPRRYWRLDFEQVWSSYLPEGAV